ncbi:MAG TPA: hypothetical protein VHC22_33155 [Pirellulales bacterium]|nr:hypothetical protein [Pirellulales bacterium]
MSATLTDREAVRLPAGLAAPKPNPIAALAFARGRLATIAGPLVVAAVATVLAVVAYSRFLDTSRHLWFSGIHDRNAHYLLGLSFALDFRHADVVHFVRDLHAARVWAPFHALLVGVVLAIGGVDFRLAVLPNLAGWVGTAVFAFLTARRTVARGGNLAGFAAAVFVLASPAHRAFATDIMLESLGACLSLAAIYASLVVAQERTARSGRVLGLVLTALFFQKYNYWLLVAVGLTVAALAAEPRRWWQAAHTFISRTAWRDWLKAQARHPLTYVLVPLLTVLGFAHFCGSVQIGSFSIGLASSFNLDHLAFILVLARVFPWWKRTGRETIGRLAPPIPQLVTWHIYPMIAWFLWPQRLGYFLWYLFRNHGQEDAPQNLSSGTAYYWQHLSTDYHLGTTSLIVAVALAVVALLSWRRLRPGGTALLCFLVVAAALTLHHPTHRSRFAHSWVAATWVAAGIGLAQLVYGRRSEKGPLLRPLLGTAALAGVVWLQFPGILRADDAPEGGTHPGLPSVLDVTDAYLSTIDQAARPAIFANLPLKFLTGWTLLERRGAHVDMVAEVRGFGASIDGNRQAFQTWLNSTPCDAIVLIDLPPGSVFYEATPYPDYRMIGQWMADEPRFTLADRRVLAQYGCTVIVWRRAVP